MERYNVGDKVKTIDFWNDGRGMVIPKGSIVKVMYDNGSMCRCDYNGQEAWYKHEWLGEVVGKERMPQTNADRIRSMSDEELAEFLCGVFDEGSMKFICGITIPYYDEEKIIEWLKSPTTD